MNSHKFHILGWKSQSRDKLSYHFFFLITGSLTYVQRRLYSDECSGKLMAHLQAKIKFSGPISVAEYMKEALTHATGVCPQLICVSDLLS